MKNKLKKLAVVALTMIGALTEIGCGQICTDTMEFSEPTVEEIDVQNVSGYEVSITSNPDSFTMSLSTESPIAGAIRIEFDLINSFVGESDTVTFDNNLMNVGNQSLQWDGTATVTITRIDGKEIDYSYSIDLQTSDSESENAVFQIEGTTSYEESQICQDRGPS